MSTPPNKKPFELAPESERVLDHPLKDVIVRQLTLLGGPAGLGTLAMAIYGPGCFYLLEPKVIQKAHRVVAETALERLVAARVLWPGLSMAGEPRVRLYGLWEWRERMIAHEQDYQRRLAASRERRQTETDRLPAH